MAFPSPFSAEHPYSPACPLDDVNPSMLSLPTICPSFVQVIFGVGFPVAAQCKVATTPSTTVWSAGLLVQLGETGGVKQT